ncbi:MULTISPECIES: type II toxin-antitoxin system Phd/YefM family antitoxin [unclassified Gemella]|uniref:type II toxin-antitoxin system Phd/YefM family antitoxin n=1 Tax=unclassified Gemella TaxID=2624949 RepID=UPI0010737521|nr:MULTISPECIES: type II toxin-antitoxin system Phd/YefM family antitoxin [unclassified Gemella]MBF0710462.1 type II toxin-antitoxin system Phd/YefM family antitoxin [Gemella sp. GL1.1]MBF0746596.1 type II toxin-antitoxin system Phd/YefM family antitoxin [Gemella sp. 19428wG2_WT2a]NYS27806.1 type II toxin-antitoxin system Phd/YefM family antitoxin [Gemella sp. GL1]TFU59951.1 type II toxin-antitoxin system Phd/YefM family antitoxin [Gemella sp. WT2a]
MPQIVPIKELRNTNEISEMCHASGEPIFVTKNGYGDLVVMSMETYENMLVSERIDSAIEEAEREISNGGVLHDAKDALKKLRGKHFGDL